MSLRYDKTLIKPSHTVLRVTALAWAPNGKRLAIVTTDKVIYLLDENGERQDKFKAKANAEAAQPDFIVRAMAYSPDSMRLAIAQSDNMVFVYKLGLEWGEKKSISSKLAMQAPITNLIWRTNNDAELVFGLADGSVKLGVVTRNKAYPLYQHPLDGQPVSMVCSPNGASVYVGHVDGSIYRFTFVGSEDASHSAGHTKVCMHPCVPYALTFGKGMLLAAGADLKVVMYSANGRAVQTEDFSDQPGLREFTCMSAGPSGDIVTVGAFDAFITFKYSEGEARWKRLSTRQVPNMYTVTALAWEPSGSKLIVGTLTGGVDQYIAELRRAIYKPTNSSVSFELTYTSKSQVQITKLESSGARGPSTKLTSTFGHEILKVDIYREQYVVAFTTATLLLGNLSTFKLSEIPWEMTRTEKLHFDNDRIVMVYAHGELTVVEYEKNKPLISLRTEHMSPFLVSCVVNDARSGGATTREGSATLAYLMDLHTVKIMDVLDGASQQVSHDQEIDWLELNQKGSHLLFRDRRHHLHLFNSATGERTLLLNYVGYVQWVPDSDVIVAQSRDNLCVWYSIHKTEQPFIFNIRGEVQGIEKTTAGATEVLVQEDPNGGENGIVGYQLDDNLVYFGAAMESGEFERALEVLDPLERTPDTEAQWQQLADAALGALSAADGAAVHTLLSIAERCYAATGDVARSRYLHKVAKRHVAGGTEALKAEAQVDMLTHRWGVAEQKLVARGFVDDAIQAYLSCHKWREAIKVAQDSHHMDVGMYKQQYLQHLLDTKQHEEAGRLKEQEGDFQQAITYYVEGRVPARAARCIVQNELQSMLGRDLLENILAKLKAAGLEESAGELLEHLQRPSEALEAYRRGKHYSKAIALAAAHADLGTHVVRLHEEWGDLLVSRNQLDNAITHYVEAGANSKAAHVALDAGNLVRAGHLVDVLRPQEQEQVSGSLAKLHQAAGDLAAAEKCWVRAGRAIAAVHMYFDANRWEDAHKVAVGYLDDKAQMEKIYQQKAREFKGLQQYKNAEKTLLAIGQWPAVLAMYKEAANYADYLRVVQKYDGGNMKAAQVWVAQQREAEGLHRESEKHFCDAGDWKSAVRMYRKHNLWEDTLRVAKVHGGVNASKQIAYAWAVHLENEQGSAAKLAMLKKMGLIEYAIDYAIESGDFEHAFQLADQSGNATKVPDIHLKHAMFLEDEGQFADAQAAFLRANKPKEAIEMYMHQQLWAEALQVAEANDAGQVVTVYRTHAGVLATQGKLAEAEAVYLQAKAPDPAIKMYREQEMWDDATRIARHYKPEMLQELEALRVASIQKAQSSSGVEGKLQRAKLLERQGAMNAAVDAYLAIRASDSPDKSKLESAWTAAARLAGQGPRAAEVLNECSSRLLAIGRAEAAASLHTNAGDKRGAVGVLCQAGLLDKARALAGGDELLVQVVDQFDRGRGLSANTAFDATISGPAGIGASTHELEDLARRGNWEQVHERAKVSGPEMAMRFVISHATKLAQQGLCNEAALMLRAQGAPPQVEHLQLYCQIAVSVLGARQADRQQAAELALKEVLFGLYNKLKDLPAVKPQELQNLQRCQEAAHFLVMHSQAQANGWPEMAAKSATSLLRHMAVLRNGAHSASLVPPDKAFYLAGQAWKAVPARWNQAFVFLNAFLDVSEAIEDGSLDALDMSDLVHSGLPLAFTLPAATAAYVDSAAVEAVKDWVLETSMQQDVAQALSMRSCANCGVDMYAGALKCEKCGNQSDACAVTGYPIAAGEKVESKGTFKIRAARDDFNTYVGKYGRCPVTGTTQSVIQ